MIKVFLDREKRVDIDLSGADIHLIIPTRIRKPFIMSFDLSIMDQIEFTPGIKEELSAKIEKLHEIGEKNTILQLPEISAEIVLVANEPWIRIGVDKMFISSKMIECFQGEEVIARIFPRALEL